MKRHRGISGLMDILLTACTPSDDQIVRNVAENLTVIVSPVREDPLGFRQAKKICLCASRKAAAAWDEPRFLQFDKELAVYSKTVREFVSSPRAHSIEALKSGSYPQLPDSLNAEIEGIAGFILACEEKTGGRGVEF